LTAEQAPHDSDPSPRAGRRRELAAFIVLAVLIWPVLAVGFVGGYGFLVWMWQIIFGPPGPPG
jgi:periplasmic nitrate reductase NapE